MKKHNLAIATFLSVALMSGTFAAPKDGVYTQRIMGHNALFDVVVTIEGGKITQIETPDQLESPGVGSVASLEGHNRTPDDRGRRGHGRDAH